MKRKKTLNVDLYISAYFFGYTIIPLLSARSASRLSSNPVILGSLGYGYCRSV